MLFKFKHTIRSNEEPKLPTDHVIIISFICWVMIIFLSCVMFWMIYSPKTFPYFEYFPGRHQYLKKVQP